MSAQKGKAAAGAGGNKGGARGGKKGAGAGGRGGSSTSKKEDEREETLQAVILADSFETRFGPFSLERPRCLLPLANTPLIEYTLEFLAMSGVADIYIYCGAHTEAVESYIHSSKWYPGTSTVSPFNSLEIVKTTARSVGDALRDLDARDLITGDFLLVHGDLVSNLPIDAALDAHRKRRLADKNAIMTMILREGGTQAHRTKAQGITPVFVIDPTKNRCLHYEEKHPLQANKYVQIDPELISTHTEMEIRTDLIDCGIDICTPDVLALWAESFDYEVPRRHFLHGVLKDYELNGKTIHTEIVEGHYAARVSNLQAYDAVSRDVLGRWTYPLVPDSNLVPDQSYKFERGGVCKENGVVLARTCRVGKNTVLGKDTSIGDGSTVSNSIVGRRCRIGRNVTIRNVYIWDDVSIGDGSTVERAIIANEAIVGQKCTISPGALLSYGVRIADNKEVASNKRITRAKRKRADVDGELAIVPADPKAVGEGGDGYLFSEDDDDDSSDETTLTTSLIYSTAHLNLSSTSISTFASDLSGSPILDTPRSRTTSFTSMTSDPDSTTAGGGSSATTNEPFHHDAVAGLYDALRENGDIDAAKLEFMGLRLSNNASDHQIRRAIASAFAKHICALVTTPSGSSIDAPTATSSAFGIPGALKFISEAAIGLEKNEDEQVDFIRCLQRDLAHREKGAVVLAAMCQKLYQADVLEEEAILRWWEECEGEGEQEEEGMQRVRGKTGVLVEWLREAESEEESEEEEEEEDSE